MYFYIHLVGEIYTIKRRCVFRESDPSLNLGRVAFYH